MAEGMALKKIGSIFLLIVAGTIILFVFLGPNQLYAKAAEKTKPWAENVYKLMHKEKEEQTQDKLYEGIENMFYALVEDLNKGEGATPCLLTHKPFVEKFMGYKIRFSKDNEGTNAFLMKGESGSLGVESINKDVCVIDSRNFYDNYLDGTPCTSNCKTNYKEVSEIEIRGKEKIYFNGKEYGLKDLNLMFKAGNNFICFFPTKGGGGCNAGDFALNSKCIELVYMGAYKDIKYCQENNPIIFYNNAYYGLKNDWQYTNRMWYYKGGDNRVAYKLSENGLSYYEFETLLGKTYDKFPEDKKGVYYAESLSEQGIYYGVKKDWEYVDKGFLGGKGWRYKGNEKEVPEKFKTELISIQEKYNIFGLPKRK